MFEIGKYYQHTSGERLYILCIAETWMYGVGLIAEDRSGHLSTVGRTVANAVNWEEITHEQWLENLEAKPDNATELAKRHGFKAAEGEG